MYIIKQVKAMEKWSLNRTDYLYIEEILSTSTLGKITGDQEFVIKMKI